MGTGGGRAIAKPNGDTMSAPFHALRQIREGDAVRKFARSVIDYKSAFENAVDIGIRVAIGRFPVRAICRSDGAALLCHDVDQLYMAARGFRFEVSDSGHQMDFSFEGTRVKFVVPPYGDILGVFHRRDYARLEVNGAVVIDIGANIGDSSIYFAIKKAKRVIAVEPHFSKEAQRNVCANKLNGIEVIRAAVIGSHQGRVVVEDRREGLDTQVRLAPTGVALDSISLAQLLDRFGGETNVLKMDCEGCEYDSLLHSKSEVLSRFSQVAVEYHYGSEALVRKFREAGFVTQIVGDHRAYNRNFARPSLNGGLLFATRANSPPN